MAAKVKLLLIVGWLLTTDAYHWHRRDTAENRCQDEAVMLMMTNLVKDGEVDMYYNATRVMLHWLIRDPVRCTCREVVVLVTDKVKPWQINQLVEDGAHVIPVTVPAKIGGHGRWADNMARMHMFNMVKFRRILYFDSDFMLFKSPDAIFDYADQYLNPHGDEWLAGAFDWAEWQWDNRAKEGHLNYVNAGLLLIKPNRHSFTQMMKNHKEGNNESFTTYITEQDLINHYYGGNWPGSPLPTYEGPRKYRLFPHAIQRQHVSETKLFHPDTYTVHVKAWQSSVPEIKRIWEMALQAIKDWDEQKIIYKRLGMPVALPSTCNHRR